MGYDQLFKRILERRLQDFLEIFFPEEAARLDFRTLQFVDKEVFANVPEGEVRRADLVARVTTRGGEPELILVHVEVQATPSSDFPRRMFEYYAVLRLHYRIPVFPVVMYLRRGSGARMSEYRENLFGQELLLFRYHSVPLARLPAEEYVERGPLAAALSALMNRQRIPSPARLRIAMLERVAGSELDQALKYLLVNVIETFFELSGEDAEEYRRIVSRKEYRAVQELELTWADKLVEKGRKEGLTRGREEGVVEGSRGTLVRQLTAKFGELPEEAKTRIESMSRAELDSLLDRVLTAETLEDLGLGA